MTTIDTTAADAARSSQAASSEAASSPVTGAPVDHLAQAKAKLDQLRAEMQAAEANFAAQQAAAEELKLAAEVAKRKELAELPARYGFKDMRSMIGHLAYYHLRGAKGAVPRQRGQKRQAKTARTKPPTPMTDTQRERLFEDLRKGGKSVIQLSKEYGISRARVYQLVQANDLPLPSQLAAA